MSYILMRVFGVRKEIASHFYWERFSVIEIAIVLFVGIYSGYIHG